MVSPVPGVAATSIERPRLIAWSAAGLEGITLMLGTPAVETKSRLERIRVEFETLVSRMDEVRSHLSAQMRQKIDAMHDDIVQFGSGDQAIFQARQAQIEAGTAVQTSLRLIDQNIDKFLASVSTILRATHQEISGRSANLNQTISRFNLLIIVISLLCVLAGAAIFAYVRRAVIMRLKRVQVYMRAQVEGCPTEMSTTGADEIAEIATATRVFVTRIANREAALQQRTVELLAALEQQTATAEVLQVINSSPGDLAPVFDAMLEKTARICQADSGFIFQLQDGLNRMVAAFGVPAEYKEFQARNPIPLGRGTLAGRTVLERRAVHIVDAAADPEYTRAEAVQIGGQRTMLGVPLIREDALIGVITFGRSRVEPFTEKQIALVTTFADQAVIAIENARLLNELRQRTHDLEESLEYQTATSDVLKVISRSTFDLQPVLNTLCEMAGRLCGADLGGIATGQGHVYRFAATFGQSPDFDAVLRQQSHSPGRGSIIGRVLVGGRAVQIADLAADPDYAVPESVRIGKVRSNLGVPLMREGLPIGVIVLGRQRVEPYTERQIELVRTFADQAVIAMENARLLGELQARTRDLEESLEYQTATSEVLNVISRSTADVQPVLDTVVETAARLCGADLAAITIREGEVYRYVASSFSAADPEFWAIYRQRRIVPGRDSITGRVALEGRAVHIPDVLADPDYAVSETVASRRRTVLGVPLLREGAVLGTINLSRKWVEPFTERQIELVRTFADQAVIAIENARLLSELQARTRDLEESLEYQTATSDVLNVISRSTADVQPVLDAVMETAARLCGADSGGITIREGEVYRYVSG